MDKKRGGGSGEQKEERVGKLGQVMKVLQEDKDKGNGKYREKENSLHSVAVT